MKLRGARTEAHAMDFALSAEQQHWHDAALHFAREELNNDRDLLERETPLREANPAAPPARASRALQRSSVEPLALDQRQTQRDTILIFLAQQQAQLDRHRQRTSDRLVTARRELEHLHWWNRDRRAELQTEIGRSEEILEHAGRKGAQLTEQAEQRSRRLTLDRERDKLKPPLEPEPIRRSPAIELERERGPGIER